MGRRVVPAAAEGGEGRRARLQPRDALEPTDYYVADATLAEPVRLTDQRPQVATFAWSPGVQLVNYTSDKGDKLQAALYLPANYEQGKKYPTIVNIYEKLSQTANQFAAPTANGFNRSVYTSDGYAVLRAGHHLSRERSRHVGGVVHGARR